MPVAFALLAAVSANWTGYIASGKAFRSVQAAWTEPRANCVNTHGATAVAFWVGLGGARSTSQAVEQVGTESDCMSNGLPDDEAWYELWPAPPQPAHLKIAPGDEMAASVTVRRRQVTIHIEDRSTHDAYTKTVDVRRVDVSSAEWIAEAPSSGHRILPLTNFGTVTFGEAEAVSAGGRRRTLAAWHARAQELRTARNAVAAAADILPGPVGADGSTFSVRWRRRAG